MMNPGLHRFARFSALATFLLIIAGGLVTSTGSGLSVPTWPFASQLFPPLKGGVFFEYGHRMVAGGVIILTVILAAWLFRSKAGISLKWLGIGAILAVLLQAVLGGATVLLDLPPFVSVAHAGLAQAFFCIMASLAFLTSPAIPENPKISESGIPSVQTLTIATTLVIYAQILLGAVMRHVGAGLAIPDFPLSFGHLFPPPPLMTFPVAIHFAHRIGALIASVFVIWTSWKILAINDSMPRMRKAAVMNLILLTAQILLGGTTIWSQRAVLPTTAHVAVGAILLTTNLILALQARQIFRNEKSYLKTELAKA